MSAPKNIILFDGPQREDLLPLTFTRPVAEIRVGITTLTEKWQFLTGSICSWLTEDYLAIRYQIHLKEDNLFVNGGIVPDETLVEAIMKLEKGELLCSGEIIIAYRSEKSLNDKGSDKGSMKQISYPGELLCILNSWDIFELNDRVLRDDFKRITKGRKSGPVSTSNRVFGDGDLFLEEGAKVEGAIINTVTGPVYIGRNAEIMEGSVIRGPLALCEYASLKMGAKIYGATTLGPYCKAGGEVHNSVFFGYTSKAHDGYLGNAVLGEWCNLGADTNNSNLKNNYALVKLWNYRKEKFMDTGLQFCGLIMGDHSKCGINTMFNTGTVVGVSANIYGAGFPRNFIPSFTWGGPGGVVDYRADIAFETVEIVMARRNKSLTDEDKAILLKVYELTRKYRKK